jgi:hypothetical protein
MILPNKITSVDKSLLGIGAKLLKILNAPLTVSQLWDISKKSLSLNSFQYFILTLDFLYTIGAIRFENNRIYKEDNHVS